MEYIDHSKLLNMLDYNPETGIFVWKEPSKHSRHLKGKQAGSMNDRGYIRVKLLNKDYKAHRLAWYYVHSEWPPQQIDHINRNRSDNRICNLRLATPSLNSFNKTPHRLSSSGVRGVFKHGTKYIAYVGRNARQRVSCLTMADAVAARESLLRDRSLS